MVHPPSSPSSSTTQFTQQFLSSVLSQRGPSSLPHSEDVKWLICQNLLPLSESFSSLHPKTATFTHNVSHTVNLLQSDDTVPILFHNVTYNITVIIWLMETYPHHPPLVFVNPMRDMVNKRQHAFVNPFGLVSIPYLQNWVYSSSILVDLARNPLRPRRTGSGGGVTEDPNEVYRRNPINKLVENVHTDVEVLRKKREVEMEGMFTAQAVLRQREEEVSKGLREM
ncbi:putative ubiquitin E2 variant, ubiquitin-conjugating enzyme/RWD [Helianthus anomalus]